MSGENTSLKQFFKDIDGANLKESRNGKFRFLLHLTQPMSETPIESLDLSVRASNCLKRAGFDRIGLLAEAIAGGKHLKEIRGCGAGTAREIMEKLFLYQYYSLKPERRDAYLMEVVALNAVKPEEQS